MYSDNMEIISLVLLGIALLFYLIQLMKKGGREVAISGAIAAILATCSTLTETWNDYTIFILLLDAYLCFMLIGGAIIDYDRE